VALRPVVAGPGYEGKTNGPVTYIDASLVLDGDRLHVFAANRSLTDTATTVVHVADRKVTALESAEVLTGPAPAAANSYEQPDLVCARPFSAVKIAGGQATCELPPLSVAALTLRLG